MRKLGVLIMLWALACASPASAQKSKPVGKCADGLWHILDSDKLAERGLQERSALFSGAVQKTMQDGRPDRQLNIIVTDCAKDGLDLQAIRIFPLSIRALGILPMYGIYVTAAYLRYTNEPDLMRAARQQACWVKTGAVDALGNSTPTPIPQAVTYCMMEVAAAAGDTEYAKWLARELGTPAPEVRSALNKNQMEIQRRIDQLHRMPSLPPGILEKLEDLKRSLGD